MLFRYCVFPARGLESRLKLAQSERINASFFGAAPTPDLAFGRNSVRDPIEVF